jgi:hypothetical protein
VGPLRTTSTYWSVWAGKLTISGVPVPVHVAATDQADPLGETSTL